MSFQSPKLRYLGSISSTLYVYYFNARGAQKRKKDSEVISLFTFLGSTTVKAKSKYVGEIEP